MKQITLNSEEVSMLKIILEIERIDMSNTNRTNDVINSIISKLEQEEE